MFALLFSYVCVFWFDAPLPIVTFCSQQNLFVIQTENFDILTIDYGTEINLSMCVVLILTPTNTTQNTNRKNSTRTCARISSNDVLCNSCYGKQSVSKMSKEISRLSQKPFMRLHGLSILWIEMFWIQNIYDENTMFSVARLVLLLFVKHRLHLNEQRSCNIWTTNLKLNFLCWYVNLETSRFLERIILLQQWY